MLVLQLQFGTEVELKLCNLFYFHLFIIIIY